MQIVADQGLQLQPEVEREDDRGGAQKRRKRI
jgi:hypothetical protein